jgi:hypoxanthine phosphoribosyltransferase
MNIIEPSIANELSMLIAILILMYGAAAIGFYLYIKRVKAMDKAARQKKMSKPKYNARDIMTSHQKVESDGVLAASSTFIGVIGLEFFAKERSPKYLIGVNRGGWLLSAYLAQRLNIDRSHLLRFDSGKGNFAEELISINRQDSILLIDDISRTGKSLQIAIDYLKKRFPDNDLSVAVLVVCEHNTMKDQIACYPYYTKTPDIELPWSSEERKIVARERNLQAGKKSIPIGDENALRGSTPDILRMSDRSNGEGIDIVNRDVDAVMKFIAEVTV